MISPMFLLAFCKLKLLIPKRWNKVGHRLFSSSGLQNDKNNNYVICNGKPCSHHLLVVGEFGVRSQTFFCGPGVLGRCLFLYFVACVFPTLNRAGTLLTQLGRWGRDITWKFHQDRQDSNHNYWPANTKSSLLCHVYKCFKVKA